MTATPLPISDATFAEHVPGSGAVLVEFWKEGCGPCAAFKPVIDRFAAERPDLNVRTYEVVLGSPLHRRWKRFGIRATPTVILWRDGEVVWRAEGAMSLATLRAGVDAALDAPPQRGIA